MQTTMQTTTTTIAMNIQELIRLRQAARPANTTPCASTIDIIGSGVPMNTRRALALLGYTPATRALREWLRQLATPTTDQQGVDRYDPLDLLPLLLDLNAGVVPALPGHPRHRFATMAG